jgi:Glycosyl hydrolase family 26
MSALLVAFAARRLRVEGGKTMRQSRQSRALGLVFARAIASLALVPVLALGLATAFSSGTGSASASSAHPSSAYSGGIMMAADPTGGYWTVTPAGAVTPHGVAPALGSPALSNLRLAQPIVGMTATADGNGYWLVASDGGIFSYGDATFYGSTGGMHLNKPIVGMAVTTDGKGYWLVASDGGIFSYGDAFFYGSTGSIALNKPVAGMAVTTDGKGYWLVASDGGIFSYGDAFFYGSTGSIRLNLPIVGMAPTPDGQGYWLVGFDGGVFTFGDADFYGSTAGWGTYAFGLIINPATAGYDVVTANGSSVAFGPGLHPNAESAGLQQGAYDSTPTPSGMAAFAQQTQTSPTVASDYLPGNGGWADMDGSGGTLNWLLAPFRGSGYTLSLGVPIIPTNSSGAAVGTLAQGATGAFNSYYVTLAQTLVAGGQADAYLRLGWEFDGSWMPWAATTPSAEASFASYFQQIVTAMRSVPGEQFRFVWNPDAGAFTQSGYSVAAAYPGNAYVDVIGLDAYDQSWATPQTPSNAWSSTTLPTLTAAQQFASSNGKPLAFCEWGVAIRSDGHGLGDDPYFINQMVSWMHSNDVTYESYFDANSGGVNSLITGGSFPSSLAAFSADLG